LAPQYFEIRRPTDEVTGILRDKKDFDFSTLTILFISQTSDSSQDKLPIQNTNTTFKAHPLVRPFFRRFYVE